ncbi:MAG: PAS domain-containing protein, partial [Alphaproteobacteria bacterium]
MDPNTYRFLDMNENACKMTGYRRDELLRMAVHDIYPPDERPTTAALGTDVKSGKSVVLERTRQRKDGTRMPVEISMRLVTYGDERVILSIFRDITERKRAEEAIRTSEAQLRQIIDLVPHQIYVKDPEGRFLLVNKTKAEAFGTTVEDLTGSIELERHHDPLAARRYHEIDREVITSARPRLILEDRTVDAKGMDHVYETLKVPYHVGD